MRRVRVEADGPVRLTVWLARAFPSMAKSAARDVLKRRDIRVNGRKTCEDIELYRGDEVTLYLPDGMLDGPPLEVPWCCVNLIVAVKPAGVLSKAESEADMEARVGAWLAGRGEQPNVAACHRLDSGTGGLLIFARNAAALEAVRMMMEQGRIRKIYHCIVKGVLETKQGVLTHFLRKDAEQAYVTVFDRPVPGARTAVTEYEVLRQGNARSLLQITLHTGRTHQIRAQMAHIGHPLLGDDKYGDRAFNRDHKARRQKLWACRLEFRFSADECPLLAELAGKMLESPAPFGADI